jgi:23S rRNA pseudouridine2457 synthase
MTAAIGFPTLRLVRTAIALESLTIPPKSPKPLTQLTLQGLTPGQWRKLTSTELQNLKKLDY